MKNQVRKKRVTGIFLAAPVKILLSFLILISGCASSGKTTTLNEVYLEYTYRLEDRDYGYILDNLLTSSISNRGLRKISEFPDYYPLLSYFPDILAIKKEHYEFRDRNFGCLTLNGFDRFDRPAVIKMEFEREQGGWKLDYVSVDYLDTSAEFSNAAVCPERRP